MANTRTSKVGSRNIKPLVLDPEDRFYVGVDAHKASLDVCIWSEMNDAQVRSWTQPYDPQLLSSKLQSVRSQVVQIVYEAGPTGFGLARYLIKQNWNVMVTSPGNIPLSPNKAKSDRMDARKQARLLSKAMLDPIYIPSEEEENHRQLQRLRQTVLADRKRAQQRIKAFLLCHSLPVPEGLKNWTQASVKALKQLPCAPPLRFSLDVLISSLEYHQKLLRECDKQLKQLLGHVELAARVKNLKTTSGIGERTALQFVLEMGPRSRFDSGRKVSKYQGLAPDVSRSGQTTTYEDLNRSGNRRIKTLLIEAAWRWIRYDAQARQHYQKMLGNTGCAQKAITAVARKLGIILWRMDQTACPYRPKTLEVVTKTVLAKPRRGRQAAAAGQ